MDEPIFFVNDDNEVLCYQCLNEPADFVTPDGHPLSKNCFHDLPNEVSVVPVDEYLRAHPEIKFRHEGTNSMVERRR